MLLRKICTFNIDEIDCSKYNSLSIKTQFLEAICFFGGGGIWVRQSVKWTLFLLFKHAEFNAFCDI